MGSQEKELYKKIEIQRISLINEIKGLDKASLNKREQKGSWNIPEVLGHLIQAEQLALSYVKKKMTVIDVLKYAGLRSSFNINILRIKGLLVSVLIIVALFSLTIVASPGNKFFKHALEWNYFVGVLIFYLLTFFMWKKQ